ncbi:XRE family transcriptional regulator [Acinetobacter sichuanensis]|uniref:helix-turn-helix domain-containing protein n=1 Tax=Acinetobacter sichuanensis TaxID=2136183 RepID=UPI00280FADA0|nr:XRE family transcriptional regulator [Acinetobacter sichuanensis]MDQ9022141.1 XRE family transcriptional regulator [Acinetobacter sichuanensis]
MPFNADLLILARQSRGLSQSELASNCNLSQAMISKLEGRLVSEPSVDVLSKLSSILNYPTEFFYEPDRLYGLPPSVHAGAMYRRKANVTKKSREKLEAILNIRTLHLKRLLRSIDLDFDLPLLELDPDEYTPEEIAAKVRQTWLIPKGPLHNLMEYVERAGCMVFLCDFDELSVDGVTIRTPDLPPCIFLNKSLPGCRQRFTLAHELGHIVMHRTPTGDDMETEANNFASALLMPADDIRPYLQGKLTIGRLAQLKPLWLSSMSSLLYRAGAIKAISPHLQKYLWIEMNQYGYKTREPSEIDIQVETPKNIVEIIDIHMQELEYSVLDMQSLLKSGNDDLYHLYGLGKNPYRPQLRILEAV